MPEHSGTGSGRRELEPELVFRIDDDRMASNRTIQAPVASTLTSKLRDYCTLTKPEVNLLILMTTSAGFFLGSQGPFRVGKLIITLVGTLLVASGTATLNQLMERFHDARMLRTANRPIGLGKTQSAAGLVVWPHAERCWRSAAWQLRSTFYRPGLAIGTLLSYLLVYTPLKRKTPLCTLLGAIPGAMPTLIGWAAASGSIGGNAWLLFGVLFLWQFPHFLAIALLYREDYAGAGFHMLPQFDSDGRFTRTEIVVLTVVLVIVTMLPLAGRSAPIYSLIMFAAGAFFIFHTAKLAKSGARVLASRVVHASVIYLPIVLGTMMAFKG